MEGGLMSFSYMRFLSLLVSIITLIYAVVWMKKRPTKQLWAIPVVSFMIHSIIFYIALYVLPLENKVINEWSSIKNLHGLLMFAIYWIAKVYDVNFNGGGNP